MTILNNEQLAAIEERDKKRTQGVWVVDDLCQNGGNTQVCLPPDKDRYVEILADVNLSDAYGVKDFSANADFIAHCSTDVPAMLHTIKVLKSALALCFLYHNSAADGCPNCGWRHSEKTPDYWIAWAENELANKEAGK